MKALRTRSIDVEGNKVLELLLQRMNPYRSYMYVSLTLVPPSHAKHMSQDFSHQMLDLLSIGRSDEQRQLYDKIHITLHDARQLDIQHQQPPLKKARTEYSRTIGVHAGTISLSFLINAVASRRKLYLPRSNVLFFSFFFSYLRSVL